MASILVVIGSAILFVLVVNFIDAEPRRSIVELPLMFAATLIGVFAFQTDQEAYRYRFFVDHNVPPRLIWLTLANYWVWMLSA